MISLLRKLFSTPAGEGPRLERLAAEGRTRELETIRSTDTVVEITLGYAPEFWCVEPGFVVDPYRGLIEGGHLILEHGRKLGDKSRLGFLAAPVQKAIFRT